MAHILVVDDENSIRISLREFLKDANYEVGMAEDAEKAINMLAEHNFDVVLSDIILPRVTGMSLLKAIRETSPHVQVILMTGEPTVETASEAVRAGAFDYLAKPIGKEQLLKTVANAVKVKFLDEERRQLTVENRQYQQNLERLVDERTAGLRESEKKYRALIETTDTGYLILNETGKVIDANSEYIRLSGHQTIDEIIDRSVVEWTAPHDHERNAQEVKKCMERGFVRNLEIDYIDRDGKITPVGINAKVVKTEAGQQILSLCRDITERKQAEEKLKASETFLNAIVENIPNMIFVKDAQDLRFVRFNKAGEDLIGYSREDLIGKNDYDFFPKEEADFFTRKDRTVLDKGTLLDIPEEPIQTKYKGERILHTKKIPVFDEKGRPEYLLGISEDITERKGLEEQLRQAHKMESIGTLAGGIAHDFNNVLYSIIGYTELTMDDVPEGSLARKNLKEVFNGAMRAKDMVQQILIFSRKADTEKKPIKIQSVVNEALKLLRMSIPSTIEIRQNIDTDCSPVLADPTQIHQVIMNLGTNAYQAMREKGGILEINIESVDLEGEKSKSEIGNLKSKIDLPQGKYAWLTISDTGHGIDKAVIEKIYDPYFTTSGPGEGSGMGLAVVHGIVKDHGGDIKVYSKLGEGTTFHVYFPLIGIRPVEPKTIAAEPVPTGTEHILLVDDEERIVLMTQQILKRLGYQVTSRTSSVEALEAFRAKPDEYDLVITDMTMPNMTGGELAPRLREIRPDIPIILCTGFSEMIDEDKAKKVGIKAYIMKPILKNEIAGTIRKVLDCGRHVRRRLAET